jgi:hypothetical protein
MGLKVYLEPTFDRDLEPLKIKQQINSDVKSAFFLESAGSLAQAIIDDAPKDFVQYSEMSMEQAFGMKVQSPEEATSFSDEEA